MTKVTQQQIDALKISILHPLKSRNVKSMFESKCVELVKIHNTDACFQTKDAIAASAMRRALHAYVKKHKIDCIVKMEDRGNGLKAVRIVWPAQSASTPVSSQLAANIEFPDDSQEIGQPTPGRRSRDIQIARNHRV